MPIPLEVGAVVDLVKCFVEVGMFEGHVSTFRRRDLDRYSIEVLLDAESGQLSLSSLKALFAAQI